MIAIFYVHDFHVLKAANYEIHDLGLAGRSTYPGQVNDLGNAVFWASAVKLNGDAFRTPDQAFVGDGTGATILPS